MREKKDNIYIYLWEEFNTVYVGRTVNPKGRHYAHKHRETESTYRFSSEHHVEHPKMIIIENDLTVEEGVEREKYWINEYRENSPYDVLNKSKGGGVGNTISVLTDEEREKKKKEWYASHKEDMLRWAREFYHRNSEKCKKTAREYKNSHKDEIKKYRNEWYESHKEHEKEYQKKYYKEHKNEINNSRKEYYKEWYRKHREERKIKNKQYREKHIDEIREYDRKRSALKRKQINNN